MKTLGLILVLIGGSLCLLNFYLSFVRHLFYFKRKNQYRFVSGFPVIGSLVLLAGLALLNTPKAWLIGIPIVLIDTGGLHWFAGVMIYQKFKEKKTPNT
jgi:hypothetical protein